MDQYKAPILILILCFITKVILSINNPFIISNLMKRNSSVIFQLSYNCGFIYYVMPIEFRLYSGKVAITLPYDTKN